MPPLGKVKFSKRHFLARNLRQVSNFNAKARDPKRWPALIVQDFLHRMSGCVKAFHPMT